MLSFNAFLAAAQWPPEIMEKLLALEKPALPALNSPRSSKSENFSRKVRTAHAFFAGSVYPRLKRVDARKRSRLGALQRS
jgi:hypothetical protein